MMTPVVFFYFRMVFVGDILRWGGMLIFSPIFFIFLFFTTHILLCNGQTARQILSGGFTLYCEAFCTKKISSVCIFIFLSNKIDFKK